MYKVFVCITCLSTQWKKQHDSKVAPAYQCWSEFIYLKVIVYFTVDCIVYTLAHCPVLAVCLALIHLLESNVPVVFVTQPLVMPNCVPKPQLQQPSSSVSLVAPSYEGAFVQYKRDGLERLQPTVYIYR